MMVSLSSSIELDVSVKSLDASKITANAISLAYHVLSIVNAQHARIIRNALKMKRKILPLERKEPIESYK